jgi:hypothetical protein
MSHEAEAIFLRQGNLYAPSSNAPGPWGADKLHGGPVLGLLARAVLAEVQEPDWLLARLTVDLFRAVPVAPLGVRIALVRQGSRLQVLEAALCVDHVEYVRATALMLRTGDAVASQPSAAKPSGPDGLPTESLLRGFPRGGSGFPSGFHTCVETRWVPRTAADPLAIWFRLPVPLVDGEPDTSTVRAVAVSDFANAIGSIASQARDPGTPPYINADATLYLHRRPEGEWFCLQEKGLEAAQGVSVTHTELFDEQGVLGRVLQARLTASYKR